MGIHDKESDFWKKEKEKDMADPGRRKFIKKLAYVTPVLTTLMVTHDLYTPDFSQAKALCVPQCGCKKQSPCRTYQPCKQQCCVQSSQPCKKQP